MYKFCRQCGHFSRADHLVCYHFPTCQPHLQKNHSGFFKMGKEPKNTRDDYKAILREIWSDAVSEDKKPALQTNTESEDRESDFSETVSKCNSFVTSNGDSASSQISFGNDKLSKAEMPSSQEEVELEEVARNKL